MARRVVPHQCNAEFRGFPGDSEFVFLGSADVHGGHVVPLAIGLLRARAVGGALAVDKESLLHLEVQHIPNLRASCKRRGEERIRMAMRVAKWVDIIAS